MYFCIFIVILGLLNMVDSKLMRRDRSEGSEHGVNLYLLDDFRKAKQDKGKLGSDLFTSTFSYSVCCFIFYRGENYQMICRL